MHQTIEGKISEWFLTLREQNLVPSYANTKGDYQLTNKAKVMHDKILKEELACGLDEVKMKDREEIMQHLRHITDQAEISQRTADDAIQIAYSVDRIAELHTEESKIRQLRLLLRRIACLLADVMVYKRSDERGLTKSRRTDRYRIKRRRPSDFKLTASDSDTNSDDMNFGSSFEADVEQDTDSEGHTDMQDNPAFF